MKVLDCYSLSGKHWNVDDIQQLIINEHTKLKFQASKASEDDTKRLAHILQSKPNITSLQFRDDQSKMVDIAPLLQVNHLQRLYFGGFRDIDVCSMQTALSSNVTLTDHIFFECNVTNELITALSTNMSIVRLALYNTNIGKEPATTLANMLKSNTSLTQLHLYRSDIGNEGAMALAQSLERNHTLTHLDLRQCGITNSNAVTKLITNSMLWKLELYDNKMDVEPLIHALTHNTILQHLSLPDKPIEPEVIRSCFRTNTTLLASNYGPPLYRHYSALNEVCLDHPTGSQYRDSVPEFLHKEEMKRFLDDLIASATEWRAMKVIVLGNERIGKTTFVRHLKNDHTAFGSTVGIEISSMDIENGGKIKVWDFAGQLEYTVTHQFFLSEEAVLYLVCFDLSSPANEQRNQIKTWLQYLNSLLCSSVQARTTLSSAKWRVMVAGLKADQEHSSSRMTTTRAFQNMFPALPLIEKIFHVSTTNNPITANELFFEMKHQCTEVMDLHLKSIPTAYAELQQDLLSIASTLPKPIVHSATIISTIKKWKNNPGLMHRAFKHLHMIGEIVVAGERIITDPLWISQLMAKFISPDEVRDSLLWDNSNKANLLSRQDVKCILSVHNDSDLADEFELMTYFGICFEVQTKGNADYKEKLYLFPSLSTPESLAFTMKTAGKHFAGVQVTPRAGTIFVPGVYCQLIVSLCNELNIYRHEIKTISSNGILLTCAGMMDGQLVVLNNTDGSIIFGMVASKPDLEQICTIFEELINCKFPKYKGYSQDHLCSECVEEAFSPSKKRSELGKCKDDICTVDNSHRAIALPLLPTSAQSAPSLASSSISVSSQHLEEQRQIAAHKASCWTHDVPRHDFFLNYRVAYEGKSLHSEKPVVQELYDHLSLQKTASGESIFVFWDQKCLNFGQDWQEGFLRGIQTSRVIVLMISVSGLQGIRTNAPTKQDNVLLEYEVALLLNRLYSTFVLPIFLGETKNNAKKGATEPLEFESLNIGGLEKFPEAKHRRSASASNAIKKLRSLLSESEGSFLDSISDTITALFLLQGIHMKERGLNKQELGRVSDVLLKILAKTEGSTSTAIASSSETAITSSTSAIDAEHLDSATPAHLSIPPASIVPAFVPTVLNSTASVPPVPIDPAPVAPAHITITSGSPLSTPLAPTPVAPTPVAPTTVVPAPVAPTGIVAAPLVSNPLVTPPFVPNPLASAPMSPTSASSTVHASSASASDSDSAILPDSNLVHSPSPHGSTFPITPSSEKKEANSKFEHAKETFPDEEGRRHENGQETTQMEKKRWQWWNPLRVVGWAWLHLRGWLSSIFRK